MERGGHQVPECRFVFVIVCGCCGVFIFVDLLLFAIAHVIVGYCLLLLVVVVTNSYLICAGRVLDDLH